MLRESVRQLLPGLLYTDRLRQQGKGAASPLHEWHLLGYRRGDATTKPHCLCVYLKSDDVFFCPRASSNEYFTKGRNNVLNIYRICPTRIATGMSSVSSVQSAAALWWKRPLLPRMTCCSAPSATPTTTLPSAPPARKPSCQVGWAHGKREGWW